MSDVTERTRVEWVEKNSPYRGNALLMHQMLAREIDESGEDYVAVAREYLASTMHCTTETIRNIESRMVTDGYLEIRRLSRYGRAAPGYRLLVADAKVHAAS